MPQPGWKLWGFTVLTLVLGVIVSVSVSVKAADRSIRQQIERERVTREETRTGTCQVVSTILAAYEEAPPTTPAGKAVAEAWRTEYQILGCLPKKEG